MIYVSSFSTPPTPQQQKHRHTSNTLPVHTVLAKSRPNPLIHSPPHSPSMPARVKHIHRRYSTNVSHPTYLLSTFGCFDISWLYCRVWFIIRGLNNEHTRISEIHMFNFVSDSKGSLHLNDIIVLRP